MVTLEGGSVDCRIGGASIDVILMERSGIESLLGSKVTLGGDASAREKRMIL